MRLGKDTPQAMCHQGPSPVCEDTEGHVPLSTTPTCSEVLPRPPSNARSSCAGSRLSCPKPKP